MPLCHSALLLTFLGLTAPAQSPFVLVATGDEIPGVGTVTRVDAVHLGGVGSWCSWLAQVGTDDPAVPTVVLQDSLVWKKAGDPLQIHASAKVAAFERLSLDLVGNIGWCASFVGPGGGPPSAQIIGMSGGAGLVTGTPVDPWFASFPAGSTWRSFGELRFAPWSDRAVLTGTLALPATPGDDTSFLAAANEYGSFGICCVVEMLAREGLPAQGQTETIERIRTAPWAACIDAGGAKVYWSCDLAGPTTSDGCVYVGSAFGGPYVELVREGTPSPVPGRLWGPLEDLALDAIGVHWTLRAALDASDPSSDQILVRDGAKLAQEGDVLPAIAPFALVDLGRGRGVLDDSGGVLWYGRWNDPAGPAEGLFLDGALVVRAGATEIGGVMLVDLEDGPHSFAQSTDGDYVVFTGTLANGVHGAFAINHGELRIYCQDKHSSKNCLTFHSFTGTPSAGAGSGFLLRAKNVLGQVTGLLLYGTSGPLAAPFVDATLCVRPPLRRLAPIGTGGSLPPASTCDGTLEVDFNAWVVTGADPALAAGTTVFAQYWLRDPGFAAPSDFVLTKAFEFTLGP